MIQRFAAAFAAFLFLNSAAPLAQTARADADVPGTPVPNTEIHFFPHNSPSIGQYVAGKTKFMAVLDHFQAQGYLPSGLPTEVGVAPLPMNGGEVVFENGKLYFYFNVANERLEGALQQWFALQSIRYPMITYRGHLAATVDQISYGRDAVEAVIQRFEENHLELQLPQTFPIAIARTSMRGGNIVEEGGVTYIYYLTPQQQIEAYFMKFCKSL